MGQNFDLKTKAERFRRRLYRSANGKILGVFSGIAESLGYRVCVTRWVGVVVLVIVAGKLGANGLWVTVMVGGFFYMLTALLMQPPRVQGGIHMTASEDDDLIPPPPIPPGTRWTRSTEVPAYPDRTGTRVDLAQLDRQLESLSRRIQRMETIVTDRQYDWDRRLDT